MAIPTDATVESHEGIIIQAVVKGWEHDHHASNRLVTDSDQALPQRSQLERKPQLVHK